MKRILLIFLSLLLTLLWGCGGKQEAAETADPTETVQIAETETTAPQKETAPAESLPEEETVPEEWISHEEAPETPTRPMEVVQEQSTPEVIAPGEGEVNRDYQPDPHENETPLAIG